MKDQFFGSNIAAVLHFALNRKGNKRLTLFTIDREQPTMNIDSHAPPPSTTMHNSQAYYPKFIADKTKR